MIKWIKEGKIRAVRIGKEFRVPEDEVKGVLDIVEMHSQIAIL